MSAGRQALAGVRLAGRRPLARGVCGAGVGGSGKDPLQGPPGPRRMKLPLRSAREAAGAACSGAGRKKPFLKGTVALALKAAVSQKLRLHRASGKGVSRFPGSPCLKAKWNPPAPGRVGVSQLWVRQWESACGVGERDQAPVLQRDAVCSVPGGRAPIGTAEAVVVLVVCVGQKNVLEVAALSTWHCVEM